MDEYDGKDFYDFAEFVFVGEGLEAKKGGILYALVFSKILFSKYAQFIGSTFADSTQFHAVTFEKGANFECAIFKDTLGMQECSVISSSFDKIVFEKNVHFQDVQFLGGYATFTYTVFDKSVFFRECKFEEMTIFSNAVFNRSKDAAFAAIFSDTAFKNTVSFTDSKFFCPVEFRKVTFSLNVEFIDTFFGASKSAMRYNQSDISFNNILLNENGVMVFESTDSENKMFSETDAVFSFKEDVKGIIRFKNVNFNNISNVSRKLLRRLESEGKVEIGPGCIKYRFQTEIRTIPIAKDNQFLIVELAQTFTNYFTAENGMNLGIEIVAREEDEIRFFYFTDEDITEDEFLGRLKKTEHDLWRLISHGPGRVQKALKGKNDSNNQSRRAEENALINAVDGLASLMSINFRVAIRIGCGKWKKEDTRALVNAIRFNVTEPVIHAGPLHQVIINKFNQNVLWGKGTTQTMDIQQ
ncbi:MAG: pentapeptide repeat-containing protein [Candidatus Aminicenantes bacterium]|nr:pentapeptide repeat-containing protein [Candidatus Aminicenantes bacterium]